MEDWAIVFLGLIGVLGGCILGTYWVKHRHPIAQPVTTEDEYKKLIALKEKYIKSLEKECNELDSDVAHWRGKFGKAKQIEKVAVDSFPNTEDEIGAFVDSNLPSFAASLPKEIGKELLSHPDMVKAYVKANPSILKKFITKGGAEEKQVSQEDIIKSRAV